MGRKLINLTGQKFHHLTVIELHHVGKPNTTWLCECDCGTKKVYRGQQLKSGVVKSCGCMRKDYIAKSSRTHGMSYSRLYNIYYAMIRRCYEEDRESYKYYGARGIKVCDEWINNVSSFLKWAMRKNLNYMVNLWKIIQK